MIGRSHHFSGSGSIARFEQMRFLMSRDSSDVESQCNVSLKSSSLVLKPNGTQVRPSASNSTSRFVHTRGDRKMSQNCCWLEFLGEDDVECAVAWRRSLVHPFICVQASAAGRGHLLPQPLPQTLLQMLASSDANVRSQLVQLRRECAG